MNVNLLPKELRPRRKGPLTTVIAGLMLLIVLPLAYYTFSLSTQLNDLTDEHQRWQERHNGLQSVATAMAERDRLARQLEQARAEAIATGQFYATDHLDELASLLPNTITLSEITLGRSTLSLRGTSHDYASMVEFAGAVAASPLYGPDPVLANFGGAAGSISFSLNVAVKVEVRR